MQLGENDDKAELPNAVGCSLLEGIGWAPGTYYVVVEGVGVDASGDFSIAMQCGDNAEN